MKKTQIGTPNRDGGGGGIKRQHDGPRRSKDMRTDDRAAEDDEHVPRHALFEAERARGKSDDILKRVCPEKQSDA